MSKGYTPSRITIKPLGGSTPDSLNHLTYSCSPRDDYQTCYYKFKDFSLSGTDTRQRNVTITAEKDGDPSKKISAQATIPVESLGNVGGGENIHHCGVNETYNTTSGKCEPKEDGRGGGLDS